MLNFLSLNFDFVKFHCTLHQEALCAKSLKHLENVITVVTKIVSKIATRALNKRSFANWLKSSDNDYSGLLMYNNVRLLSCDNVWHRFAELLEEVKISRLKQNQIYPGLSEVL